MSYEATQKRITLVAGANLSANQFYCVDLDTTATGSQAILPTASGQTVIGVLQDKPTQGQPGNVCFEGVTKVVVGSTGFTAGDQVMTDATGAVVTATSNKRIIGRALVTGVSGDIAAILLRPAAAQS